MTDLSILIPARNEIFLSRTIQDILDHIEGDTEIICVLDGYWPDPPVLDDPRVTLIHLPKPIGQREATNVAARLSRAKWVMKVDAHCSFDQGFDVKMLEIIQDDLTAVPVMRNLHAFDWVCQNGHRRYQGPPGVCEECGLETTMDVVWYPKPSPQSKSYCFDSEPHFQYFREYNKRPEGQGDVTETMSLQGSCWMLSREKYHELNICDDETFGSWGSQGIEVAVKTWLSGGRVVCNSNTWYAHLFRTQGKGFSFPYPLSNAQVSGAKNAARELFFSNKWHKQIRPLSWLVEKFWPVPGWSDEDLAEIKGKDNDWKVIKSGRDRVVPDREIHSGVVYAKTGRPGATTVLNRSLTKGIVYYTDSQLDEAIAEKVRWQIYECRYHNEKNGHIEERYHDIVAVSLKEMEDYKWLAGDSEIVLSLERGYLTMFRQILVGLEELNSDIVFFCEHDVLYHPSHFQFIPPRQDVYYYNLNWWKVDAVTGKAIRYDSKQTSQLCAHRDLLVQHYRERVKRTELKLAELGDSVEYRRWIRRQGFEPGSHKRKERVDDYPSDTWWSEYPNVDIRHNKNLTPNRWRKDQFRDQRNCENWEEADKVPGWGFVKIME